METRHKVILGIAYALACIFVLIGAFSLYNIITMSKPVTLGSTYASVLNKDEAGNPPICEIDVWTNDNNNGLKVMDVQFNSYTDVEGKGIKGLGFQAVGDYSMTTINRVSPNSDLYSRTARFFTKAFIGSKGPSINYNYDMIHNNVAVYGDWTLYNTDDLGTSSYVIHTDKLSNTLYIDIQGNYYSLNLKNINYKVKEASGFLGLGTKDVNKSYTLSWFELVDYIIESANRNSARSEYSTAYINMLDCADYVSLKKYNGRSYEDLPNTTDVKNFLQVKVNYHKDGLTESNQSRFKMISGSSNYSYYNNTEIDNYWNAYSIITLTEKDFVSEYNKNYDSYRLSLDNDFAKYLSTLEYLELNLDINLANLNYSTYALDMTNIGFKLDSFKINSSNPNQSFVIIGNRANNKITSTNIESLRGVA